MSKPTQPIAIVPRVRCSRCGSFDVYVRTSREQGDGSRLSFYECRLCGCRFQVVYEPEEPLDFRNPA